MVTVNKMLDVNRDVDADPPFLVNADPDPVPDQDKDNKIK